MNSIETGMLATLILINIIAIILMAYDKKKAEDGGWRVPERTLLMFGALGGALGIWLGMRLFHHKTKHLSFLVLIPIFFFIHVLIFYSYYYFRFLR